LIPPLEEYAKVGPYVVVRWLGRGGFAQVYEVESVTLNRRFALKLFEGGGERSEKEEREAKLIAGLYHPNILSVVDFGECAEGRYLVMELMAGGSLWTAVKRDGPLSWEQLQPTAEGILRALDYLGSQGLVHGDVKPANVLLDAFGTAKLADFGLAGTEHRGGTAAFLSPEALLSKQSDHRSDLYALGATLFAAMTGRPPRIGKRAEIRAQLKDGETIDLDGELGRQPEGVRGFLASLLAEDPATRVQTAAAALDALPARDAPLEDEEPAIAAPRSRRRRPAARRVARAAPPRPTRKVRAAPATEAELVTRAMVALVVIAAAGIAYMLATR
jgi:serine/threonine protein kinase